MYLDDVYWIFETPEGPRISTDRSFLLFIGELGCHFKSLTVFGRTIAADGPADYILPGWVDLVRLPHYSNLRHARQVLRGVGGTVAGFRRGLDRVDLLWIFGPHPFALTLALLALLKGKRVVLGVRQDSVRLYEARLASRWSPPLLAVRFLDRAFRFLARKLHATVQGAELAERYGRSGGPLLQMTESIVRREDVATRPVPRDWAGPINLLTVGRFETEKNPVLLVEAFARLQESNGRRYRLTWVGRGPLEDEVRRRAEELSVSEAIAFQSYVAFGDDLLDLYRRSHVFVHVSLSEGMPKVLIEALACATPIVATDVGGVRAALDEGRAGLLVPPDDLDALVAAVSRIVGDAALRERLVVRGLELARDLTLEGQVQRVLDFVLQPPSAAAARR